MAGFLCKTNAEVEMRAGQDKGMMRRGHHRRCLTDVSFGRARNTITVVPAYAGTTLRVLRRLRIKMDVVKYVDGRDIGEQSDAVLRTAMPGHDEESSGAIAMT
jgi:hypothetical protein